MDEIEERFTVPCIPLPWIDVVDINDTLKKGRGGTLSSRVERLGDK